MAELHLRRELGFEDLAAVTVLAVGDPEDDAVDCATVTLEAGGAPYVVRVRATDGEPRRQSCADLKTKPARVYEVVSWGKPPA